MSAGDAWYAAARSDFLNTSTDTVVAELSSSAVGDGWHIEPEQHEEWKASIDFLHRGLGNGIDERLRLLRDVLSEPELDEVSDVVLEYNFKRRGLRMDTILLCPGAIIIIEFKRSQLAAADHEQVLNYCVNLVEFHEETRRLCEQNGIIVVPILALTRGKLAKMRPVNTEFFAPPWSQVRKSVVECAKGDLAAAIINALSLRKSQVGIDRVRWLASRFSPSSTILDAAISLYGQHQVSAINEHAAPIERIRACTSAVANQVIAAKKDRRNHLIIISGTPGSGKTLVGLDLTFDLRFRDETVFVTGNAPLVEVLNEALKQSYRSIKKSASLNVPSGYTHGQAARVIENADFKIVKAHRFLGNRGEETSSADGSIVIFDEAQRTYEKGRPVLGHKLADHEADLIMQALEESYDSAVIVALLGHNQAINSGERGAVAWFEAAIKRNWTFAVDDETLGLAECAASGEWATHPLRRPLQEGHLTHSLRFYRNKGIEEWAHCALENNAGKARLLATDLDTEGHTIWLTRDLATAKHWARDRRVGDERAGMIGSAQGRRLAAEGIFVELKPDIAKWMITPTSDIRSSNMLETAQNQYQVQGLELDYTIVCWDADLRREEDEWKAYKISGSKWRKDKNLDVAKNGYRVLLTRARKGMVIFIPYGDRDCIDETRSPEFYKDIAQFLMECGAKLIS